MKKLLIDGDILIYAKACTIKDNNINEAFYNIDEYIRYLCNTLGSNYYIGYLTSSKSFRKAAISTYKANRTTPSPIWLSTLRTYVKENHGFIDHDWLEADDLLAITQTKLNNDTIICSNDKDLLQIPGLHFNKGRLLEVTNREAELSLWEQCLKGDSTDNIPGLKGIGDVKAKKYLEDKEDLSVACLQLYNQHYQEQGCLKMSETFKQVYLLREYDGFEIPSPKEYGKCEEEMDGERSKEEF